MNGPSQSTCVGACCCRGMPCTRPIAWLLCKHVLSVCVQTVQEGVKCNFLCPTSGAVTMTVYWPMCSGLDSYQTWSLVQIGMRKLFLYDLVACSCWYWIIYAEVRRARVCNLHEYKMDYMWKISGAMDITQYWCMEVFRATSYTCVMNLVHMRNCMWKLLGLDVLWRSMTIDRSMTPTMYDVGEGFW